MTAPKVLLGNKPLRLGRYEVRKTFDWRTLVIFVAMWLATDLVPFLEAKIEEMGNDWGILFGGLMVGCLTLCTRLVIEWLEDNTNNQLPR
jgi:hypothetical protein